MRKRKKKPNWRKIYDENWKLCHDIVDLRDGRVCTIPGCGRTERLDLDHCITRQCKLLFFETENLGYLCSPHHQHKSFRHGGWVDKMVTEICKQRAGVVWYENALEIAKRVCPGFSTLMYQELQNARLKRELATLIFTKHPPLLTKETASVCKVSDRAVSE